MKKATRFFCFSMLSIFVSSAYVFADFSIEGNLIANPSFEENGTGVNPVGWQTSVGQGKVVFLYEKDSDAAHSGNCCVMIEGKDEGQSGAIWYPSSDIEVRGNTTYEFSAWVKSDFIKGVGYHLDIWEHDGTKYISHICSEYSNLPQDWHKVSRRFVTSPSTKRITTRLRLCGFGKVRFDDVALIAIADKETANLLDNGSFELATVPGSPDHWGHWDGGVWGAHYAEKFITEWWGLDENNSYHGKKSIRIHRPFNDEDKEAKDYYYPNDFILYSWFSSLIEAGNSYTLSCYMKSDTPGLEAKMQIRSFEGNVWVYDNAVNLDTSWKRYVLTTSAVGACNSIRITFAPKQKGTIWIDAVQLEKGKEATAYTPSKNDLTANNKKEPVPEIFCAKVVHPPDIDGILDDKCYQEIKKLDLVTLKGDNPSEFTEGYIFQDGQNLYIAMKCYQREMNKLKSTIRNNDGPVWEDDSVEIFIDHNLDKTTYFRFGVNAVGTRFDGTMLDGVWNGTWESQVYRGIDFWSVEIKIPLEIFKNAPFLSKMDMPLPAPGDVWGINLCRTNHTTNEYTCWSPGGTSFHKPELFGRVKGFAFASEKFNKYNYVLGGTSLEYENIKDKSYNVVTSVSNNTGKDKRVNVEVNVKVDGNVIFSSLSNEFLLPNGNKQEVRVGPFSAKAKRMDEIGITLLDAETREILSFLSDEKVKVPTLMEVIPELNYYTDEKIASVFILNGFRKNFVEGEKVIVELEDEAKKTIFSRNVSFSEAISSVEFEVGKLESGRYRIIAKLIDGEGTIVSNAEGQLLKLEKKKNEVKINQMNRMLVMDNKPFIPFGQNWAFAEKNPEICRRILKKLSQDFNFVTWHLAGYSYKDDKQIEKIIEFLDMAQENNLKVNIWYFSGFPKRDDAKEAIERLVPKLREHPALLWWPLISDEVAATEETSEIIHSKCGWVKELDPYHPGAIANHYASFKTWKKFGFPGDIIELHDYVFGCPWLEGIPSWTKSVVDAGNVAKEYRRPFHAMQQTFDAWAAWSRGPSASETEASTYLSIVHGATAIEYYARDESNAEVWKKVRALGKEIKELTPILASYVPTPEVGITSSDIHVLLKKYKGKYYLITVNSSENKVEAGFDLSGFDILKDSVIKVMFENRDIRKDGRNFTDVFKGYQRHVYEIY